MDLHPLTTKYCYFKINISLFVYSFVLQRDFSINLPKGEIRELRGDPPALVFAGLFQGCLGGGFCVFVFAICFSASSGISRNGIAEFGLWCFFCTEISIQFSKQFSKHFSNNFSKQTDAMLRLAGGLCVRLS